MGKKYNTIEQLNNIIIPYIIREIKYLNEIDMYSNKNYAHNKDIIKQNIILAIKNFFDLNNAYKIIKEIILLICEIGDVKLSMLIQECNFQRPYNSNEIITENDLIEYIKSSFTPFEIVTDLLNNLLSWRFSILGYKFYYSLNTKLEKELKIREFMTRYSIAYY